MDKESLRCTIEDLETFIELKQQQFLILAWIQLKKNLKTGYLTSRTSHHNGNILLNPNNTISYSHNYYRNQGLEESYVSESQKGYKPHERLITDYANTRGCDEQMFQTFNPGSSGYPFRKELNQDLHRSYSKNLGLFKECDIQDDDEFEDIVLDRLSKLEENINQMMKQKKLKEDLRGYVGAPLTHNKFKHDLQIDLEKNPPSVLYRKESDSQNSPRSNSNNNYQSWQTSPIKSKQQNHIHNLKYIPLQKNYSPVNISKIKNILEQSHQDQDQSILDNIQYFPSKQHKYPHKGLLYLDKATLHHHHKEPINHLNSTSSKGNHSATYFNRYGASQTARNTTQVHFFPKNIQMKTVIEPKTKYIRTGNTHNAVNKDTPRQAQTRFTFKPRQSGASDSSGNSYLSMPSWRVNLSALY